MCIQYTCRRLTRTQDEIDNIRNLFVAHRFQPRRFYSHEGGLHGNQNVLVESDVFSFEISSNKLKLAIKLECLPNTSFFFI